MKTTKTLLLTCFLFLGLAFSKTTFGQTGATCSTALSLTISPGQNTGWQTTTFDTLWYSFTAADNVCLFDFDTKLSNKKYLGKVVYGTCGNIYPADYFKKKTDTTSSLRFINLITSQVYKIGLVFTETGCTTCSNQGAYKINYISATAAYTGCAVASCTATPTCEYLCNGNFEQFGGSNSGIPQTEAEINKTCGWISGNDASPDFFHASAPLTGPYSVNIPTNFVGCEPERTGGNGYVGLFTANNFYEAIVSPLKSTLVNGQTYKISFYTSLAEGSTNNTTDGIAFAFANNYVPAHNSSFTAFNSFGTTNTPTIVNTSAVSKNGWTALNYLYTANGTETHFILGGLPLNQNPTLSSPPAGITCSGTFVNANYYYFDDISIRTQPNFTLSATNTVICTGNVTLSVNPPTAGTSYTWTSNPATSTLSSQSGPTVVVSPSVTTTYSVTTGTGSCAYTDVVTVNVVVPSLSVTQSSNYYCPTTPVTLTATGSATTYTWMPPNVHTQTISVSPGSTSTYTVYGNGPNCPLTYSATATVSIPINPSFSISATTVCVGASITVTPGPNTILDDVIFTDPINGDAFNVNPYSYSTAGSYSVFVNISDSICHTLIESIIPITVVAPSTPTLTVTPSQTICVGNTATLTVSGASTYTWMPGATTGSMSVVSPTATTIYSVTGTGICGNTSTKTITVTVIPNLTLTASASPTAICSGQSSTLTASGATTYTWMPGSATTSVTVVSPTVTTIYTVTGSNGTCINTKTVQVTVNPTPTINISTSTNTVCSGAVVVLTGSGASTYTWAAPSCTAGCNSGVKGFVVNATTIYTLTGTNAQGCVGSNTIQLTAVPKPTVTVNSATICAGSSATLTANGSDTYTWSPITSNASSVIVTPSVTTVYTVSGKNNGCTASSVATATVTVIPNSTVFSIITSSTSPVINNGTGTNTVNLSTSLSNTTGLLFDWQPSGATTPTTAFNLSQPEIISVTVNNQTCNTITTQSICLNYVSTSCAGTFTTLNNATLTSTATLGAGTATYNVTGTLTINWSGVNALENKTFIMATGSKVEITATTRITLNNIKFYGCNDMWRGIEIKTSAASSASVNISGDQNSIEDAYMGIYCISPSVANLNPIIEIYNGVLFNKNYYDVYLENTNSAASPYTFTFAKSRMYSQSTNNSPGGNLKCSGYYSPTVKSRSYAGLYAKDAGIIDFNVNVNPADYNQVKNKDYGLYFNNTNANVNNVAFSDAVGFANTFNFGTIPAGVGVYSKNSGYLNVKPASTPTTGITSTFVDMGYQVVTNNTYTVDVQNTSYTTSVQGYTVDPSWLYKPVWNYATGIAGFGLNGIFVTNARDIMRVNNNTFMNNYYPVTANYTVAPSSTNTMSIAQNTINTTSASGVREGVTFNSALSFTPTVNNMRIAANTFSNVTIGVKVVSTSIGLRVSNNTFTIHPSATNPKGIYMSYASAVTVDNNAIYGALTGTNVGNWNVNHHGILLEISPGCKVKCNTISNVGIGIEYRGGNSSSGDGFFNNTLNYPIRRGLFISNGGIIGTQGSSGGASANQWLGSWPAVNTADPNKTSVGGTIVNGSSSNSINSILYVHNNSNELPDDNYIASPSNAADRYLLGTSIFTTSAGNYATCPATVAALKVAQTNNSSTVERDADFVNYINNLLPSTNTDVTPQDKFMLKQYLFDELTQNPSTDNTLTNFVAQQQNTSIDAYHDIDSLLANGNLTAANTKNAQASQSNDITQTQNTYNTLYINGITNQSDLINLNAIAELCPQQYGTAVYQARALLQSITYVGKVYADSCDYSKVRKEMWLDDEPTSVSLVDGVQAKLYPNPNNGSFILAYDLKKNNEAEVLIYDVTGKVVYKTSLDNLENMKQINTNNLHNGIYFIQLIHDKNLLWTDKLIISK